MWLECSQSGPILSANIITLRPGGYIKWNQRTNHGHWYYVWTEEAGGYFFIEFAANDRNHQQKRHILKQVEEDKCILLPLDYHRLPLDFMWAPIRPYHSLRSRQHVCSEPAITDTEVVVAKVQQPVGAPVPSRAPAHMCGQMQVAPVTPLQKPRLSSVWKCS